LPVTIFHLDHLPLQRRGRLSEWSAMRSSPPRHIHARPTAERTRSNRSRNPLRRPEARRACTAL
jgi:hypothetical protein